MKRVIGLILAIVLVSSVAAFSGKTGSLSGLFGTAGSSGVLVKVEDRNPWTHLQLNNSPEEFRFAIVSDRTGGHRSKIFSQTVDRLNLLQPEFVMSVGDLIEGGLEQREPLETQWKEFDGYVNKLQMPFFYVPGNHDYSNRFQEKYWGEKLGRSYYHFVYRNVLFLMINSDDPPKSSQVSKDQIAYFKSAIEANPNVRHTLLFLHKPLWTHPDLAFNGWPEIEKLLSGRPYTVFCGHVHIYQRFIRNGMNYYQMATTGGGSKLRGIPYGEFDHICWVTMKKDGPMIANLMVDGILPMNLKPPKSEEVGVSTSGRLATHKVRGKVLFDGKPTPGAVVIFHPDKQRNRRLRSADAIVEEDGSFTLSTYAANDGAPIGDYAVTITWRDNIVSDGGEIHGEGKHKLPVKYSRPSMSGIRVTVKEGNNEVEPFRLSP